MAKPQCEETWWEGGGPHSWEVQCGRAKGHEGPCRLVIGREERIQEGVLDRDPKYEVSRRLAEIRQHMDEIARLEVEISEYERTYSVDYPGLTDNEHGVVEMLRAGDVSPAGRTEAWLTIVKLGQRLERIVLTRCTR